MSSAGDSPRFARGEIVAVERHSRGDACVKQTRQDWRAEEILLIRIATTIRRTWDNALPGVERVRRSFAIAPADGARRFCGRGRLRLHRIRLLGGGRSRAASRAAA